MDDMQREYHEQLSEILTTKINRKAKIMLVENLINSIREVQDLGLNMDYSKSKYSFEVLSTSISECHSISFPTEKDV